MATDGFFRDIADLARHQGWRIEQTKKGHWRFIPPNDGEIVITSGTPSDHRTCNNFRSRMKRSGLRLPEAGRG
jgi:hypothetical protein